MLQPTLNQQLRSILILVIIICLPLTATAQGYKQKQFNKMVHNLLDHTVPEINAKLAKYDSSIIYLDARELNEFNISKIENAKWVGYTDFDLTRVENLDKNQPIIVYCSVGYRSEKITERLKENGFTNISNMTGGLFEWVNFKKPILNSNNEITKKIHAFDKEWGKWLDESIVEKVYN